MRIKKVFSAVSCILAAMLVANSVVISGYAKNDVKSSNRKVNLTAEQKGFINNIKSNESSVVEVPKNDIVTLGYVYNNWGSIYVNGKCGFVNVKYLKII